jgi:hypothetical protein
MADGLQFDDWLLLSKEMEQLGFTVDAARTDTGKRIPVSLVSWQSFAPHIEQIW